MDYYTRPSFGFGTGLTPLIKKFLIIYSAIYIAELILMHWVGIPVVYFLQLHPYSSQAFQVWQLITHPFIHDPVGPIGFLIDCLVFFFFAGSLESVFGSGRFLIFFYFSALGAAICGLAMSGISGFNTPFLGMTPSILSMVVIFGFLNPEASILLFFVLPIKAKYISYGTIVVVGLTFLAKVNPFGAYHLGGILFGYIYFKYLGSAFDPNLLYVKYHQWRYERNKRSRFKVYDGFKDSDDNDKPTIH